MAQHARGSVNAVLRCDQRTKFLAQFVKRFLCGHAVSTQPGCYPVEHVLHPVIAPPHSRPRYAVAAFDHKRSSGTRPKASEQFDNARVKGDFPA